MEFYSVTQRLTKGTNTMTSSFNLQLNDAREAAEAAHDEATRMRIRVHELEKSGSSHDSVVSVFFIHEFVLN